jgi:hypothetical protein
VVQTEINWSHQIFEVVLEVQLAKSISAVEKREEEINLIQLRVWKKTFLISVLSKTRNG